MKFKQTISLISAALFIAAGGLSFAKGAKDTNENLNEAQSVSVGTLVGPSGIPSAYLIENVSNINNATVTYEKYAAANLLLPKLIKGEVDIGFLPPNVAAKAFTTGNGSVVMLGVAGNGMLSLISTDPSITDFADLRGKTVAVAGQGATPEYVFRYILRQKGIAVGSGADEVQLDFSIPNAEIAAAVITGKVSCAVVPEPFSTVATEKSAAVRRVFNMQDEFEKACIAEGKTKASASYPMTLIVANAKFAQKNPQIAKVFQNEYNEAQLWTKANPKESGILVEKAELGLSASVVEKAIPFANFTYVSPSDSRSSVEGLLNVFLDFAPESIGGALPKEDFYFK